MVLDVQRIRRFGRRHTMVVRLLRNWREVAIALQTGAPVTKLVFRSGIELEGPAEGHLDFLFTEIWIDRVYTPRGYEVKDGDVVIDVGANVGVFAAFAALVARNVEVFAYEPFPESARRLRQGTARIAQSRVHVFEQAVAAASGPRVLRASSENWMVHSVSHAGSAAGGLPVTAVSLDDLMTDHGIARCDLLKLDCEGSEYEILAAAQPETLERVARIVGEYHALPPGFEGRSAEGVLRELLSAKGFRVEGLYPSSGTKDEGVFHARRIADCSHPVNELSPR